MKIKIDYKLLIGLLLLLVLLLSYVGFQMEVNLLFLAVCGLSLFYDKKFLFLLFVVMLPTNGFINSNISLFGYFHVTQIVNLFATIAALMVWNKKSEKMKRQTYKIASIEKIILIVAVFLFLYLLLTNYRIYYHGMERINVQTLINRTIKLTMMFVPLFWLIRFSANHECKKIIHKGFLLGLGVIALSAIMAEPLNSIGIQTKGQFLEEGSSASFNRRAGSIVSSDTFNRRAGVFLSMGDENSAGGYLAVGFAYVLFLAGIYIRKYQRMVLLLLIIGGVIATGSRAAFAGVALVFLLYVLSGAGNKKEKLLLTAFIVVSAIAFYLEGYFHVIFKRFQGIEDEMKINEIGNRLGGWKFYLDYILSDIGVLLFGTTKSIYKSAGIFMAKERSAHNFFITLVYRWGIFPFLFFVFNLYKLLRKSVKWKAKYAIWAMFIPFLVTANTVSDTGIFIGFILALVAFPRS